MHAGTYKDEMTTTLYNIGADVFHMNQIQSVAKRKACLQPEKTHGYQYLFTMQFFDSYVYRSRINKGH